MKQVLGSISVGSEQSPRRDRVRKKTFLKERQRETVLQEIRVHSL